MTAARALRLLPWLGGSCVLALSLIGHDSQMVDDRADYDPPTAISTIDRSIVTQQEAQGLTCTTKPSLTNAVVVQDSATDRTSVVSFDEALAGAEDGSLYVRLYCAPADQQ